MSSTAEKWTVRAWVRTAPAKKTKQAARPRAIQGDIAELRRCANPGCDRRGVSMVQRWSSSAEAYECACCGQLDPGW